METRLIVGATSDREHYHEFPLMVVCVDGKETYPSTLDPTSSIVTSQTFGTSGKRMFFAFASNTGAYLAKSFVDFTYGAGGWKFAYGFAYSLDADGIVRRTIPQNEGRVVYGSEKLDRLYEYLHHHPK